MSTPAHFELHALLAPITEAAPTGSDPRSDVSATSSYQQIKSARNLARTAERSNPFSLSNDAADDHWRTVLELAPKIIATQSKDLEVASWYAEALLRRHGFAGLSQAFALLDGLVEQYWPALYPMPDEDGIETRVAPLSGLNGEGAEGVLIAPIRNCQITQGQSSGPYTYWQYQQAVDIQRQTDERIREDRSQKLGFSLDDIEKAVSESSVEFFVRLRADLTASLATYRRLGQNLDELCGLHDAPSTRNITNILEECLGAVMHLSRDKVPEPEEVEAVADELLHPDAEDTDSPSMENQPAARAAGPIATREEALEQLIKIAAYFRKAEPHSPLSYLLEKAEKWGRMPLHELIQELIPDSSAQAHFNMLTGVTPETAEASDS